MTPASPAKKTDTVTTDFSVTTGAIAGSKKAYVEKTGMRIPVREIALSGGEPAFHVYDTSGVYTDEKATIDIRKGLSALRREWILARGDVEEVPARSVLPEDNGYRASQKVEVAPFPHTQTKVLRGKVGKSPTQLAYARAGLVTKEME